MNRSAKLLVRVSCDATTGLMPYGLVLEKEVKIDGPFVEVFEPIDVCDDARLAVALDAHTEATARTVRKKREYYADYLADVIARELVQLMESSDTRNGYSRDSN